MLKWPPGLSMRFISLNAFFLFGTRFNTQLETTTSALLEVIGISSMSPLRKVTLVYPSLFEGFGLPVIEAMQSGVPLIASNTSSLPEVGGDAALYASPNDPDAIAKQMLLLYKDETVRNTQIEKGLQRTTAFSWDKTADQVWENIVLLSKK